jgi:hypothetical protein
LLGIQTAAHAAIHREGVVAIGREVATDAVGRSCIRNSQGIALLIHSHALKTAALTGNLLTGSTAKRGV